jgi:hypothetical protein
LLDVDNLRDGAVTHILRVGALELGLHPAGLEPATL